MSTVKTASTMDLSALNKKRSVKVVMSSEEEGDKILSKTPEGYSKVETYRRLLKLHSYRKTND